MTSNDGESEDAAEAFDDDPIALHNVVGLDVPRYRRADVARLAGIEHETSVRWWRAMGFPEVPEEVVAFSDADIEMARRLAALSGAGVVNNDSILRLTRLLGASFSRIAEAQIAIVEDMTAWPDTEPTRAGPDRSAGLVEALNETVLDLLEDSLVYVWRRHLLAALGHRLEAPASSGECAVGFADLSGFTKLSQRVPAPRLAELIDTFEETAFDVVSARGGRVVKLIGDEVMFVADTLTGAVDIGLAIGEQLLAANDVLPIHCGVAYGPTVSIGGDVFGATVNLAARLTEIARPGTLVVAGDAAADLAGHEEFEVVPVQGSFDLAGIGRQRVVNVRRAAPSGHAE